LLKNKHEQEVFSKLITYVEAGKILKNGVPDYIEKGSDVRIVKLTQEDNGYPCGGTHVKHISDFAKLEITKITKKGKTVRFSYKAN
jgi:Ser-tRNA(Ala) deacylase AlaX